MNAQALIDTVVHQSTILVAHLATASGLRAPLEGLAEQVFADLVKALREQNLGHQVIADMFGMAVRTYHRRVRDLTESRTCRGQTLWSAVFSYIGDAELRPATDILRHFHLDDATAVRAVLSDVVDSGLVFRTGRGERAVYRAASTAELAATRAPREEEGLDVLVWAIVHRFGPLSSAELAARLRVSDDEVGASIQRLRAGGHVQERPREGAPSPAYVAETFSVALGEPTPAWGAALVDHYQAVVAAMCAKLGAGHHRAEAADAVGGSTFDFELWPGHALEEEVMGHLRRVRETTSDLRTRVEQTSEGSETTGDEAYRVTFYAGQFVKRDGEGES